MSSRKQPSSRGWVVPIMVTVISLAVTLTFVLFGGFVIDNFNYFSYRPDGTIESFVTSAGMSDKGKFFFYASQPTLENAEGFNMKCGRVEAQTAILGCYAGQKIHIYDVNDTRLTGIRETTAAHEMLHAAYGRLGPKDKQGVNRLLGAELDRLSADKDFVSRMDFYDRTEPGEKFNELHSIIGTEIGTINPVLETYYKRYFTDRSKVVALHTRYKSVFDELKARADELIRRLAVIDAVIKSDKTTYNGEAAALEKDIADFNAKAASGGFGSQAEFSAERRRLVAWVDRLESLKTKINSSVQEYNRLVSELNGISTQTKDLNKSIDSSLASPPSL